MPCRYPLSTILRLLDDVFDFVFYELAGIEYVMPISSIPYPMEERWSIHKEYPDYESGERGRGGHWRYHDKTRRF